MAYYENGELREKGINQDGVYVIQTFMDRKGQELVANGSGHYLFTTDKGVKVREGNYENGLQTGEWRTYQIDGSPLIISNFKDGKMNGQYIQFHQNGNIHSRGEMVDDQKNGQWNWFYDNGQKQSQKTYEMGKIVGEEKFWREDGQVATVL